VAEGAEKTVRAPGDAPLRGLGYMIAASASFAAMNALTASLARAGMPWQTSAFARAGVGLAVAIAVARARGASLAVGARGTMWTRSLAGSAGMLCTFYALAHLPLSDATALLNTTPLWIALLAYLTLREAAGGAVLVALAVAGTGIALIERPSLAVGNAAGLVALGSGAASALAMVSLRRLSRETPEAVVVHFSAVATAVTGALLGGEIARRGHPPLGVGEVVKLLLVGVTATVGQLLITRAYALDRAARVGAAGWIQVVFGLLLDLAVMRHAPPALSVVGMGLIVMAGVLLLVDARREE
jgi:drug/metabolite transporter (DMT)-like permease